MRGPLIIRGDFSVIPYPLEMQLRLSETVRGIELIKELNFGDIPIGGGYFI